MFVAYFCLLLLVFSPADAVLTPLVGEDSFRPHLCMDPLSEPEEKDSSVPESRREEVFSEARVSSCFYAVLLRACRPSSPDIEDFFHELREQGSALKPEFLFKENGIILALQAKNWGEIGLDKEISRISVFLAKTKLSSSRYQVSENPEEWRFLETGLAQDWIIRETIASAQKMMEHSKSGDAFLIFGNTPTFLARILERYFIGRDKAHASYRRIVYLPASGKPCTDPSYRLGVTPERWRSFVGHVRGIWDRLEGEQFPDNQIFIVDLIGGASYIDYFIRAMVETWNERAPTGGSCLLPNISLMTLGPWRIIKGILSSISGDKNKEGVDFSLEQVDGIEEKTLTFKGYEISVIGPFMDQNLKRVFDSMHPSYRLAPTYYPMHWSLSSPKEMQERFDASRPLLLDRVLEIWDREADRIIKES